jgi:hypothetical protein
MTKTTADSLSDDEAFRRRFMAEMGRKGGLKGGKKSLDTMTKEERSARALKAARARWNRS